jgi:single-strand DNA-binding protein
MYLNKAFVYGNLTRDPELRSLPSGAPVTSFSLATNRVWNDRDGKRQESTDYHNIVVFGRQAETVAQYLKKGSSALVEGRITTRSWDAGDGTKKYRTEIIADRVQFGPRTGGAGEGSGAPRAQKDAPLQDAGPSLDTIQYPDAEQEGINPEDIPF